MYYFIIQRSSEECQANILIKPRYMGGVQMFAWSQTTQPQGGGKVTPLLTTFMRWTRRQVGRGVSLQVTRGFVYNEVIPVLFLNPAS